MNYEDFISNKTFILESCGINVNLDELNPKLFNFQRDIVRWALAKGRAVEHTNETFPCDVWQKYASPVWMDIKQSDTLQKKSAREDKDERHICPLQLEVIQRCIELWTNPNDIVLEPFGGIGSVPYVANKLKRRAIACELKESYYRQMVKNVESIQSFGSNVIGEEYDFSEFGDQISFDEIDGSETD